VIGPLLDGTLRIWDAHSGEKLHRLSDQSEIAWTVAVSPDGRYRLSRGGGTGWRQRLEATAGGNGWGRDPGSDHTLRLWEIPPK